MSFFDKLNELRTLLNSGISPSDMKENYGINSKRADGLIILDYDQIRVKWTEPYGYVCRGLILEESTLNVVAFGLDKFFNFGEHYAADVDFRNCKLFEKLDGTMLQRWWNPIKNCFEFSTRFQLPVNLTNNSLPDSLVTWQELIDESCKGLEDKLALQPKDETWVFELCSPLNIVVVHHDTPIIRLIAARNITTLNEIDIETINFPKPLSFSAKTDSEVQELVNSFNGQTFEGMVALSPGADGSFKRVKFKNIDYVRLHRLADKYVNAGDILNLARSNDFEEIIIQLPKLRESIILAKSLIDDEIKNHEDVYHELAKISTKREFAIAVNNQKIMCKAALFSTYDGKRASIKEYFLQLDDKNFANMFKSRFMTAAKTKLLKTDFIV